MGYDMIQSGYISIPIHVRFDAVQADAVNDI